MLTEKDENSAEPIRMAAPESSEFLLSDRARGLLRHLRSVEGLAGIIDTSPVIDVRARGAADAERLLPQAISIEVNAADPDEPKRELAMLEDGNPCIVLRNVLQYLPDYRRFVSVAFSKLAVSGYLIIIVPHQFLLERKLVLPSRIDKTHRKFYTPATLLAEVEEAIDPLQYRVRLLLDNDHDYDYSIDLERKPSGQAEIVLCLQRIEKPAWWRELDSQDRPVAVPAKPSRYPPPGRADAVRNLVVAPDENQIRRILVLKLDHRGDFLMAEDAFRLLRSNFPDALITLVCGEWNSEEANALGLFNEVLPFNFFPEDSGAVVSWVSFSDNCAKFQGLIGEARYDLALDLRFYEDTRELLRFVQARHRAGIDPYCSFPWLTIPLSLPVPTRDGRAQNKFIEASAFSSHAGEHRGFEIAFENERHLHRKQTLIWGPYVDLRPGDYEFEILVEPIGGVSELLFDISSDSGHQVNTAGYLKLVPNESPRIHVTIRRPLHQFEFRLFAPADGPLSKFRFKGLRYVLDGILVGVHQREAMALLVHLVQLRLENPYTTSVHR